MNRNKLTVFLLVPVVNAFLVGCPRQITGYLVAIRAEVESQPTEVVRNIILKSGAIEESTEQQGNLCLESRDFRKALPTSGVTARITDCYRASPNSKTGWAYSIGISIGREGLRDEAKKELEVYAEELKRLIEKNISNLRTTLHTTEIGYGFSLLPY